jgi:hypothetical protein
MSSLERYGITWSGGNGLLHRPMEDGYWTPFHIAQGEIDRLRTENANQNEELMRTWFVLKDFGFHPGRTDDRLADCVRSAFSALKADKEAADQAFARQTARLAGAISGRAAVETERDALAQAAAHVLMLIDVAVDNFPQSELEPLREALRRCPTPPAPAPR